MACFIVPATEAVITTVAAKVLQKKESQPEKVQVSFDGVTTTEAVKIPFSRKLKWLNHLLWEVVPCLPLSMYGMARLLHGFHS